MRKIYGIDHGNGNIKTEHCVFPCGLVKMSKEPSRFMNEDIIKYKNTYYELSDTRMPYRQDKTNDLDYFVLTLFALAKEAKYRQERLNGSDIVLSVGLPPADFSAQSKAFYDYFTKESRHGVTFSFNGKEVNCYFRSVKVTPQNFAAVITQRSEMIKKYRTVNCIDIGDGTVDLLVLKKGKPDLRVRVSNKSGIAVMKYEIVNRIQQDFGIQIDGDLVEQVLLNEETVLNESVISAIKEMTTEWVQKIIDELHASVPDFRTNPTIFLGGGSILLKEALENSSDFSMINFLTDIRANAIGYQKIAEFQEVEH